MEKKKLWIIIIFTVIVYLLILIYADFGKLIVLIKEFPLYFIPLLCFLTLLNYLIRYIKWSYLLKKADVILTYKQNFFVFFSGLSMIITPGKIGEIWKSWLIKDINNEKISKTLPVVIVERITDILGFVILIVSGGLYYYEQSIYLIFILVGGFLLFYFSIRSEKISSKIVNILEKRLIKYSIDVKVIHTSFRKTMEPKGLVLMVFLSAFGWFFECIALYLTIIAFGEFISINLSTFIFSFASLAGAVSMIPGGIGIAEGTISGLLQLFSIEQTTSVGISIIVRATTLWFGVIMGLIIYILFKGKFIKNMVKTIK